MVIAHQPQEVEIPRQPLEWNVDAVISHVEEMMRKERKLEVTDAQRADIRTAVRFVQYCDRAELDHMPNPKNVSQVERWVFAYATCKMIPMCFGRKLDYLWAILYWGDPRGQKFLDRIFE